MTDEARAALTALCAIARWSFGAAAVSVAVVDDDGLTYVAAEGASGEAIVGTQLRPGQGIAGFVAATGQSITVHDLAQDPRFARDVAERTGYIPRSIQCVPFHDTDGDVAGVISLLDRTEQEGATVGSASIEWFTAVAAPLCASGDAAWADERLDGLAPSDRARAGKVLDAVIDAFRR